MPVLLNPNSEHSKEMERWEQRNYNPSEHPYPRMLYKAQRLPGRGKWACSDSAPSRFQYPDDNTWDRACQEAELFTRSCQKVVQNEREHQDARHSGEGWRDSVKEALEFAEGLDREIGNAAAERNFEDRRMSDKAKAEAAQVESETFGHMGEIPEKPIKRRGRPRKTQVV